MDKNIITYNNSVIKADLVSEKTHNIIVKIPYTPETINRVLIYLSKILNLNHKLFANHNIKIRLVCQQLKHPIGQNFFMSTKLYDISLFDLCVYKFLGHYEQYSNFDQSISDIPKLIIYNIPEKFLEYFNQLESKLFENFKEIPINKDYNLQEALYGYLESQLSKIQDRSEEDFENKDIDSFFDTVIQDLLKSDNIQEDQQVEKALIKQPKSHNIKPNKYNYYNNLLQDEINKPVKDMKKINKLRANIRYYVKPPPSI